MTRFILKACAFALALAITSPSLAADMPGRYGEPAYGPPGFSWYGFYLGLNGGYGWGTSNWSGAVLSGSVSPAGPMFGGTLGFNMQAGNWVFGVEGDIDGNWMSSSNNNTGLCVGCAIQTSWFATARGRVGYAFDRALFYVTGGGAFGDVQMKALGGTASVSRAGWTVGTGLEYSILGPWSAKVEYLYADFGSTTCGTGVCGVSTNVDFKTSIIRLGVNYRFW